MALAAKDVGRLGDVLARGPPWRWKFLVPGLAMRPPTPKLPMRVPAPLFPSSCPGGTARRSIICATRPLMWCIIFSSFLERYGITLDEFAAELNNRRTKERPRRRSLARRVRTTRKVAFSCRFCAGKGRESRGSLSERNDMKNFGEPPSWKGERRISWPTVWN